MKFKSQVALAGVGSAMILSGTSDAAFIGLSIVATDAFFNTHPNASVRFAWNAGPSSQFDIYRVYANFNSNTAADRVNSAYGTAGSPLSATVVDGNFHNSADFYGVHYNLPSGVVRAHRAWDTYMTINDLPNGGTVTVSPDFDDNTNSLGAVGSSFVSTAAAVFIAPESTQGLAVSTAPHQAAAPAGTFRVLIAQFTVTQGALLSGTLSLEVGAAGQTQQLTNLAFSNIPAPGALVLLVFQGLGGRRCRTV